MTRPLIRWVGGKRWMVPKIAGAIRQRLDETGGRYIEPFLGGAALALAMGEPPGSRRLLSDVCVPVIDFHRVVQKAPEALAHTFSCLLAKGTDRDTYYAIRAQNVWGDVPRAARFLYLNRVGFNGLYRVNRKGTFNVPYGGYLKGLPTRDGIVAAAVALKDADIRAMDFRSVLQQAASGDVVFCDPPYFETFSDYAVGQFSSVDHEDLAAALERCHHAGADFILCNRDCLEMRRLYGWAQVANIREVHRMRVVRGGSGVFSAMVATSDLSLVGDLALTENNTAH